MAQAITIETTIKSEIIKVWQLYTDPAAINNWNHASTNWACKDSKVDLQIGGRFCSTMYAIDGSANFVFGGKYTSVIEHEHLAYTIDGGRKVTVDFTPIGLDATLVTIHFDPETQNTPELQKQGWQDILNSFRDYCHNQH
jgi:uncharacterized protein YndB with AHSA1/START domain